MSERPEPIPRAPLFIPNKMAYVRGKRPDVACILCAVAARDDRVERLEVFRTDRWGVTVNLYPYNPGHVMLFPLRHVEDVRDLRRDEEREVTRLQRVTLDVLERAYEPTGFNVGYNLGRFAGASLAHLHLHVVPRYASELGFLDVLAHTRTIVEDPRRTLRRLRPRFRRAWAR